jgi:hypothetical protein
MKFRAFPSEQWHRIPRKFPEHVKDAFDSAVSEAECDFIDQKNALNVLQRKAFDTMEKLLPYVCCQAFASVTKLFCQVGRELRNGEKMRRETEDLIQN